MTVAQQIDAGHSTWVARVPGKYGQELREGETAPVRTPRGMRFGDEVLVSRGDADHAHALGVVMREGPKIRGERRLHDVLVTTLFPQPLRLADKLHRNAAGRGAADDERAEARRRAGEPHKLLRDAAVAAITRHDKVTTERDGRLFLYEVCRSGDLDARTEFPVAPATRAVGTRRTQSKRIDVLVRLGTDPLDLLVVETEWTSLADEESAAQAYEYARRLKEKRLPAPAKLFEGVTESALGDARVRAIVVGNKTIVDSLAAEALGVTIMDYAQFAQRVADRNWDGLPDLADHRRTTQAGR